MFRSAKTSASRRVCILGLGIRHRQHVILVCRVSQSDIVYFCPEVMISSWTASMEHSCNISSKVGLRDAKPDLVPDTFLHIFVFHCVVMFHSSVTRFYPALWSFSWAFLLIFLVFNMILNYFQMELIAAANFEAIFKKRWTLKPFWKIWKLLMSAGLWVLSKSIAFQDVF